MRATMARHSRLNTILLWIVCLLRHSAVVAQDDTIDHSQFADSLTTALYSADNECTSSWGISMAFSLVYPSSIDDSEEQIRTVLGYPEDGDKLRLVWEDTSTSIDQAYEGECLSQSQSGNCRITGPTVEIANSVWIDNDMTLNPEYEQVVGAYLEQIDFDDATAGKLINDWVNDTTNGLIDTIVGEGPLGNQNVLIAINSIYLKGSWLNQFSEQQTSQDIFYSTASRSSEEEDTTTTTTEARFMHQIETFPYSHDAIHGFQIVRLNFAGTDRNRPSLSMLFVLPMSDALGFVSSSDIHQAVPQLSDARVALAIPKFKYDTTYQQELMSSLRSIGMTAPFEGGLCIQSPEDCSAYIGTIIHKTFIDVNEDGVEAAAVTMMMARGAMGSVSLPPAIPFVADHPFQYFIYDETEDLILFEGRVRNPGIYDGDDEPAPLQAKHADGDAFWQDNYNVELAPLPEFSDLPVATDENSYTNGDGGGEEEDAGETQEPTSSGFANSVLGGMWVFLSFFNI